MSAVVCDRPGPAMGTVLALQELEPADGVLGEGLLAPSDGSMMDCHLESSLSGSQGCPDDYYIS